MKEFQVNDYLSLKLEEGKTNIYVKGRLFRACKALLLAIPDKSIKAIKEINSIDELADLLRPSEEAQEDFEYSIDPETEFWGHCSNLQSWYQNEYDTRLIHSNMAFGLLKRLVEAGDPLARNVLSREISKRCESGYLNTIDYILEENMLDYLDQDEKNRIILNIFSKFLINGLTDEEISTYFFILLEITEETGFFDKYFGGFLEVINSLSKNPNLQIDFFHDLVNSTKNYDLFSKYFNNILNFINRIGGPNRGDEFYFFVKKVKEHRLLEFHKKEISKFTHILLGYLEKSSYRRKNHQLMSIFRLLDETGLINEHLPFFINRLSDCSEKEQYQFFLTLNKTSSKNELFSKYFRKIEALFITLLIKLDSLSELNKYDAFYRLLSEITNQELLEKHFSTIEDLFLLLFHQISQLSEYKKFNAFFLLISSIKKSLTLSQLLSKYYDSIEQDFLSLFADIDKLKGLKKDNAFVMLINNSKNLNLEFKYLSSLENIFPKLPLLSTLDKDYLESVFKTNSRQVYNELIGVIQGTGLENQEAFYEWKKKNSEIISILIEK